LSPRVVFLNGHSDTLSVQACNYICTVALAADDWYTLALLFASPLVPAEFKVLVPRDFAHKRQLSEVPEAQVSQILWHPSDHSKQLRRAAAEAAANAAAAKAAAAKVADATTADYDDDYALHDDDTDEDDEDYVTAFDGNSSAPDTLARHFVIEDEKRVFKLLTRAREYAYDVLGASSSATSARVVPVDEPPYSHTPSVLACPMLHLPRVLWRKSASQKALHRQQPDDADDARCDLMLPLAPLYALDSVLLEMVHTTLSGVHCPVFSVHCVLLLGWTGTTRQRRRLAPVAAAASEFFYRKRQGLCQRRRSRAQSEATPDAHFGRWRHQQKTAPALERVAAAT
ncbi:MAG: hypothetical protein MHM6MM_009148, partial [Cercozoa sp. M6MM]